MNYQEQKDASNLQLSYERLEALSSQRNQLKIAIQKASTTKSSNNDPLSSMIMSTGSSFLVLDGKEASILLEQKLKQTEVELRDLCHEIQGSFEEKDQAGE